MRLYPGLLFAVGCAFGQASTPYTLIDISRHFNEAGRLTSESRFLFAVNRDGAIVSVDLDPSAGGMRQILDFQRGYTAVVNPRSRSVSTFSYHPQRPAEPCDKRFFGYPDAAVLVESRAGEIEGIPVQRVSVVFQQGREMDVFMAPSLGCQILRTVVRHNGLSLETSAATDIRITDPDPKLFHLPTDYSQLK